MTGWPGGIPSTLQYKTPHRRTDNWFLWFALGFVLGASFAWFVLQELPALLMEM